MENEYIAFSDREIKEALLELSKNYYAKRVNNNQTIFSLDNTKLIVKDKTYYRESMKRSGFHNVTYDSCKFERAALVGSKFYSVVWKNSILCGNSFVSCNFDDITITSDSGEKHEYTSNNFSNSDFTTCTIENATFKSGSFVHSIFNNCIFRDTAIESCTLDSSEFRKCKFESVDMSNLNIDFTLFSDCKLKDVKFPFYQFPYIIGSAELIKSDVRFFAGAHGIYPSEYMSEIENLIIYFYDKHDYFPMCNLYLMKNDLKNAKKCLKQGVFNAIKIGDFRMIKNFCNLGKYYDLFDYESARSVLDSIDSFIIAKEATPVQLNSFLINSGEIRSILKSASSKKATLRFEINTNISKDDLEGKDYISEISECFNSLLSNIDKSGYSITVSSHSPFDIDIEAVGAIADILTIAQILIPCLHFIIKKSARNANNKAAEQEELIRLQNIVLENNKKFAKASLEKQMNEIKQMKSKYKKQQFDKCIDSITQSIYSEFEEIHDKDVMMFRIDNKNNKKKRKGKND
jgi:uncharacterized protein YjbI with pentapeptide repeats